jgi:hypothetical protein
MRGPFGPESIPEHLNLDTRTIAAPDRGRNTKNVLNIYIFLYASGYGAHIGDQWGP